MICVVLPAFNHARWTDDCLDSLKRGTIQPSEIVLIDNGDKETCKHLVEKHRSLNIHYIRSEENLGINGSWNLGLDRTKMKNILFLNNDTYVNKYFIEKIIKVMENPEVGICVPTLGPAISYLESKNHPEEDPTIEDCIYIEGWAFTIKKEILDKVGCIPVQYKTFMGDTYFFECSTWLQYRNVKMINNFVYHYGSTTLKDFYNNLEMIDAHKIEDSIWRKDFESLKDKIIKLR